MVFLLSAAVIRSTGRKATSALLNSFAAGGLQRRTAKNCFSTTTTALNVDMSSPPDPLPYVAAPYSYAFGRSQHELKYNTIGQILDERVAEDKGIPKIISHYENIEKTFTELKEDADRIARALYEELGLKRGDVLGLWGNNSYNWITIQYACARVGVILCTINPYYQKGELMYALKKGGVKALFMPGSGSPQEVVSQFGKILAEGLASDRTKEGEDELILEHLVTIDGASYDAFPGTKRPLKMHTLAKLKQNSSPVLDRAVTDVVSPDDTAIIMFTSGTTGKPKGAYLSHFTMVNNARLCNYAFTRDHGDDIAFLVPLPYFHSFAATFGCIASTAADFKMITPSMKYNVEELVAAIQKHKASHMIATPTLVIDLKDFIGRTKQQVPSLKCVISGGASMPVETAKEFLKTVPSVTDFRIGYGATELGPASTLSKGWHSFENRIQTIGTPCDFVELKVINPVTKEAVKLGETGEICSRGYNTMIGYWKDPVKTKEAIDRAGWYNTGDLGVMDEGGYLKIVGRSKEMIIVGGENVYPREIEEVLHTHPAILDVYVVGVPDPRKGEVGCAWIKLVDKNAPISEEELKKFCQDNLAYFKVPKYYLFVDEFPTTSVGKAKKFVMREITVKKLGLTENK